MPLASKSLVPRSTPTAEQARAIAGVLLEGFDKHYALFRECARAAQPPLRGRQLARDPAGRARPDRLLRPAGGGDSRAPRARVPLRGARRRRAVGAGQAALHRAPDRPQAARVRRDLLQFGVGARSCTASTSTTASSSCARRSPPSTSTPIRRRTAATIRCSRGCATRSSTSSSTSASSDASPISAAICATFSRRSAHAFRGRSGSRRITRSRCCPRRSSATRPPTSSGASSTASARTRSSCRSSTTRTASSISTHC